MDEENLKTLVTPEKFSDILNLKDDSPDDHVLVGYVLLVRGHFINLTFSSPPCRLMLQRVTRPSAH